MRMTWGVERFTSVALLVVAWSGCGGGGQAGDESTVAAVADVYGIEQDQILTVDAPGLLANDSSSRGLMLYSEAGDAPSNGSLTLLINDGSFAYTPAVGFVGDDTFTYRATDLIETTEPVQVTVTVTAAAGAPTAAPDNYTLAEDVPLVVDTAPGLLANDNDPQGTALTASVVTPPMHGTLALDGSGTFTYTPVAHYFGSDSFVYAASDGTYGAQATVSLTITTVPDAPIAATDSYTLAEDTQLTLAAGTGPLANDSDADGDSLAMVIVAQPASGTLIPSADGALTFTPALDFNGALSFTYTANDAASSSSTTTVQLTITPVNDAPVVVGNNGTTIQDEKLDGFVSGTDIDGDVLTYRVGTAPQYGSVVVAAGTGTFRYVPTAGYVGPDTFTVIANDGQLDSAAATVGITVNPLPAPEVTSFLPVVGARGRPLQISGQHFATTATVTIGGVAATVVSCTKTYLVVTIPDVPAGNHSLVVTRDGLMSPALPFTLVPWIETISLDHGTATGTITLTGASFGTTGTVTVGGLPAVPSSWANGTVTLALPNGLAAGAQPIRITTGGTASNTVRYVVEGSNMWIPGKLATPRTDPTIIWTGNEMIVWGGDTGGSGDRYDPVADVHHDTSFGGAPSARSDHTAVWTGTEMLVWGGWSTTALQGGGRYDPRSDSWTVLAGGPVARADHCAVWTGTEMLIFGGRTTSVVNNSVNTGGRYNPTSNTWQTMSTSNAPSPRSRPVCVWTGQRMIVWSGVSTTNVGLLTGGSYNPGTDTWTSIAMSTHRVGTTFRENAAWTGTELYTKGYSYDPTLDAWTALPLAARNRTGAVRVWTGSYVIAWGGCEDQMSGCAVSGRGERFHPASQSWGLINSSGSSTGLGVWTGIEMITESSFRYTPATNTWTMPNLAYQGPNPGSRLVWDGARGLSYGGQPASLSVSNALLGAAPTDALWTALTSGPGARYAHTATMAGTRMIVFGGLGSGASNYLNTGGRYDPIATSWSLTSQVGAPSPRAAHSAVWSGSELLVFGGSGGASAVYGDGFRYNPATDAWTAMSSINAPSPRANHVAVWTGTELIIWGGQSGFTRFADGASYNPGTDTWTPIATSAVITARSSAAGIWTGTQLLVWGGQTGTSATTNTGGLYTPGVGWTATPTTGAPSARSSPAFAWTGTRLFIWGGTSNSTGGLLTPGDSSWTATSMSSAPAATDQAVWTGKYILVSAPTSEPRLFVP